MAKLSFRERLRKLFGGKNEDVDLYDELTDILIEADVGAKNAVEIVDGLQKKCREEGLSGENAVVAQLRQIFLESVRGVDLMPEEGKVNVYMLLGVNGVGKTTSAAKLAKLYGDRGVKVVLSASDTFRAAAVDQIAMHGERLGIRVVKHQMGSDPGAVVFDAADACRAQGGGLVLADTAGRLQNKANLVNELKKIDKIARAKADEGCYKKILVIDATTGQNAVRQAEVFNEAVGLDAIVLAKYDSTAKGGCLLTIGRELGIPVAYLCTGEKYPDIELFDAEKYVRSMLDS
ncbi:MAG: signal recognition particle-docking protein FtsY [Treponema sp.]|nr:signal recognition particle-docking protein FtsY [Treponema sp.]